MGGARAREDECPYKARELTLSPSLRSPEERPQGHTVRGLPCAGRGEFSPETNHAGILSSHFQPPSGEKINFYCLTPSPRHFVQQHQPRITPIYVHIVDSEGLSGLSCALRPWVNLWHLGRWVHEPTAEISGSGQVFSHCGCLILP